MKRFRFGIWFVLVVFMFSVSACVAGPLDDIPTRVAPLIADGIVLEINTGTVANGIGSIAGNIAPAAKAWANADGSQYVLTWGIPRVGQAWTVFDGKSITPISDFLLNCGGKGNICSIKTWNQLEDLFKASGWHEMSPEARVGLARIIYIVLVGLSSKEFVMPVMLAPVVDKTGDVDWARFFQDAVQNQMCAPLYRSNGVQFNPCAVGPQT